MQAGDKIAFGGYDWGVLDAYDNKALIITDHIIDWRPYHDEYVGITWADCALRKYLNGEFYNHFNDTDRVKIVPVTNKNPGNLWYDTDGGEDTQDNVFLLSLEEATCRYFGDSGTLYHNPCKNQRYWFQRKDENNFKRKARGLPRFWYAWWWLRTPGRNNVKAVYIHGDGCIGIQGNNILKGNIDEGEHEGGKGGGVRPALWLSMENI
jgi:hypothetical protein